MALLRQNYEEDRTIYSISAIKCGNNDFCDTKIQMGHITYSGSAAAAKKDKNHLMVLLKLVAAAAPGLHSIIMQDVNFLCNNLVHEVLVSNCLSFARHTIR